MRNLSKFNVRANVTVGGVLVYSGFEVVYASNADAAKIKAMGDWQWCTPNAPANGLVLPAGVNIEWVVSLPPQ